jgi:riboflavin transporter FmnP
MKNLKKVNSTSNLNQLVRASMLIALGIIIPVCFHTIKNAGAVFLPMHIPILIGGFVLSAPYAVAVGIVTPVLSYLFTGMPPVPVIYVMPIELAAYGLFISFLYNKARIGLYPSLISGMIGGRIVSILGKYLILHLLMNKPFALKKVASALFITGLPGIIIQIILVPIVIYALEKSFPKLLVQNND